VAVPRFEEVMLPLLRLIEDGKIRKFAELVPAVSDQFRLTQDERDQLIPSRRMTTIRSRTYWAAFYLDKAGLLTKPNRGALQITDRGRSLLAESPISIDISTLERYPEFQQFRAKDEVRAHAMSSDENSPVDSALSPEETLVQSYQSIRLALQEEVLERLRAVSPSFFEEMVIDLLVAMGYGGSRTGVAQAIGKSGDGGIDGVINEDKLGLDVVYVQAKRWQDSVGRPIVQAFTGSLEGQRASKGVLITTSSFTKDAREFVKIIGKRIVLIDGETMAGYMIDHDVGVTSAATYVVKRVDNDYFDEV